EGRAHRAVYLRSLWLRLAAATPEPNVRARMNKGRTASHEAVRPSGCWAAALAASAQPGGLGFGPGGLGRAQGLALAEALDVEDAPALAAVLVPRHLEHRDAALGGAGDPDQAGVRARGPHHIQLRVGLAQLALGLIAPLQSRGQRAEPVAVDGVG